MILAKDSLHWFGMNFFLIIQGVLAVLIILCVLLQQRAAGLGTSGGMNTTVVQRRGAEKVLYQATIVMAMVFSALTILPWYM